MTAGLELYRNMLVTTMATPESWVRVRVRVRARVRVRVRVRV